VILLRPIQEADLPVLQQLGNIPGFINLSQDVDVLKEKIQASIKSFKDENRSKSESKYWFVAEDIKTKKLMALSMIAGQHGTQSSPHFFFQIGTEEKHSKTINTGFLHGTVELGYDTDGPSEIGGLVVDPEYRNTSQKIGKQISFVRFLFMAMYRQKFKSKIIAELLPPINKKGLSPLWEAIGRRFTNMDYWEADELCQKNKEFILSLFPEGKIYTTFFSAEARNAIGKVSKDTEPVLHMLTKIGFKYVNQVDPFDGGPHLWANSDELLPIKNTRVLEWSDSNNHSSQLKESGLIAVKNQTRDQFASMCVEIVIDNKKATLFDESQRAEVEKFLKIKKGDEIYFMPF